LHLSLALARLGYPVAWQHNFEFMTQLCQNFWQCPHHVCQSTGLREGRTFRSYKHNTHKVIPFNGLKILDLPETSLPKT
jgi:uncharacterized protein YjaG (DUF416 family)